MNLVRAAGGAVIHVPGCLALGTVPPFAGSPWLWAQGRSVNEVRHAAAMTGSRPCRVCQPLTPMDEESNLTPGTSGRSLPDGQPSPGCATRPDGPADTASHELDQGTGGPWPCCPRGECVGNDSPAGACWDNPR